MMISDLTQKLILKTETGGGLRILWTFAAILALAGITVWYDVWAFKGFSAPDAMDAAQVARNLAVGHGYSTGCLQPFSLYLLQKKQHAAVLAQLNFTKNGGFYPDLANAPLYPALLAGLMKLKMPRWDVQMQQRFWSIDGHYQRYEPEFFIAVFNQFLLLSAVVLTFFIARKLFDSHVAWLAALFTLGSDLLWKFSSSGLSTLLLLLIFLGLTLCLATVESLARVEPPNPRRLLGFTLAAGGLVGLGMLTRYSFGWLIVPVLGFLALVGGQRRSVLIVAAGLIFGAVVSPWLARNYIVSGTLFGTAGFALIQGTYFLPGMKLLQSTNLQMSDSGMYGGWTNLLLHKLGGNALSIFQNDLPHLGGWAAILFFAGLLLGFRNSAPRRLRYFTLMCLGMLIVVQALGRTWLSDSSPELNSENLLVLLTPLVVIFGTAFFLTLLDQMALPALEIRYAAIIIMGLILCLPFIANFLPPKPSPASFPPYYPPEIQKISSWFQPGELMMSDVPWAVAWYGQHPCIYLSRDTQADFSAINDYFQPVKGLYLTNLTLDDKFFSNVVRGDENGWGHLVLQAAMHGKFPPNFPLQVAEPTVAGLLLADRQRWPNNP